MPMDIAAGQKVNKKAALGRWDWDSDQAKGQLLQVRTIIQRGPQPNTTRTRPIFTQTFFSYSFIYQAMFGCFIFQLKQAGSFRKRQPTIDLARGVDVAFAVFDDLRDLSGAVVGVDF